MLRRSAVQGLALRAVTDGDRQLLQRLFAASRAAQLAMTEGWSATDQAAFVSFQCDAQHSHYRAQYPNAEFSIIAWRGEDSGRLYVDRSATVIQIIDIALLPEYRGQGLGTDLMQTLIDEAHHSHKCLSLQVEPHNPARRLYERLGFSVTGEIPFYLSMQLKPR